MKLKNLKVNLHITERCNYGCRYCFAHFGRNKDLTLKEWQRIIDNLSSSEKVSGINFAGGEPMLYKDFPALVEYAKRSGFKVSIISNGFFLLDERFTPSDIFFELETLGISVDSFNEKILVELGCCDRASNILSQEKLIAIIKRARALNPNIKIKLNTVVSKLNVNEKLVELEKVIDVDRWKFLKMKPFRNKDFSNLDLTVSDEEFERFLKLNERNKGESVPESSLTGSYIIIDNRGNLLDNADDDYTVVGNLLEENFEDVFARYSFDAQLYSSRYSALQLENITKTLCA